MSHRIDLDQEIISWLLEKSNPSIRYWTLRDLLNRETDDPDVREAQDLIMDTACVQTILNAQTNATYWGRAEDMYNPKYTATTHNLLILAELGAKLNKNLENAIEHIFLYQRNSGHFLIDLPKTERGRDSVVRDGCCIDGNILMYLIHFGYLQDKRTQNLLDFIIDYYDFNDGGWPCRAYSTDLNRLFPKNCYMGRMKVLKALSFIPKEQRNAEIQRIITSETEIIFENQIWKYIKNPDGSRKEKAGWTKFGFPLFYNSDALEVLDILSRMEIKDNRMHHGIKLIESLQQKDGTWLLKNSFNGKMICDIEVKNKPSKWITLRALKVLKSYYS